MIVPRGVSQNAVNTLTLFVDGTKITEKTVYVYVQGALNKVNKNGIVLIMQDISGLSDFRLFCRIF